MRTLSPSQDKALEKLAEWNPRAKVIGWNTQANVPVLREPSGREFVVTRSGKVAYER